MIKQNYNPQLKTLVFLAILLPLDGPVDSGSRFPPRVVACLTL
jgi:hypothetical protein